MLLFIRILARMTNTVHQSRVLTVLWNHGIAPDLVWRAIATAVAILDMVVASAGSTGNKDNSKNTNQTLSGQVTVHRSQSQQSDHRTVPTREVPEEEDKPSKPPVAPKPVFCNSHNCRLSPAHRGVQIAKNTRVAVQKATQISCLPVVITRTVTTRKWVMCIIYTVIITIVTVRPKERVAKMI